MDFSQTEANPLRRFGGISIVVLFHILVGYALITGLARKVVDVIREPLEAKVIEEIKPPPPDKPPPPPPKVALPPPPFIPPPEVQIQQPSVQNVISVTTTVKPASPVSVPMTKPEQAATAQVRVAPVVDAKACEKPPYPSSAERNEEEGVVTVAFLIGVDGHVVDSRIEKSSGYRDLDKAASAGLSMCKFKPGTLDGKPVQGWAQIQYVWKLPEQ